MSNFDINILKSRLEGKTVSSVEFVDKPDSVCKVVLNNGSAFIVHATDSFWVEDCSPIDENRVHYHFGPLIDDYTYYCKDNNIKRLGPVFSFDHDSLHVFVDSIKIHKRFELSLSELDDWERKVLNCGRGREQLRKAFVLGSHYWYSAFKVIFGCPEDLVMPK